MVSVSYGHVACQVTAPQSGRPAYRSCESRKARRRESWAVMDRADFGKATPAQALRARIKRRREFRRAEEASAGSIYASERRRELHRRTYAALTRKTRRPRYRARAPASRPRNNDHSAFRVVPSDQRFLWRAASGYRGLAHCARRGMYKQTLSRRLTSPEVRRSIFSRPTSLGQFS